MHEILGFISALPEEEEEEEKEEEELTINVYLYMPCLIMQARE